MNGGKLLESTTCQKINEYPASNAACNFIPGTTWFIR